MGAFKQREIATTQSRYDGDVYEPARDDVRLGNQLWDIWRVMAAPPPQWWSLPELERATGHPQASISAQLRHLRKERFGSHVVEKQRSYSASNLWVYRLKPNPNVTVKL